MSEETPIPTEQPHIAALRELHGSCSSCLENSLNGSNGIEMGKAHGFAGDIAAWNAVLATRPESFLLKISEQEYIAALVNVSQGQYRNAFKALRLVLELQLQAVYLSANLVERSEWLASSQDTIWRKLVDYDLGPLSKRFSRAFFPGLEEHVANFRAMAETLYRELSETIHGNVPNHIPLPTSFTFDANAFKLWHEKASTTRTIIVFALSSRYLHEIDEADRESVRDVVSDELGHINPIRALFGGPTES